MAGYESLEDLAQTIDWEGGVAEFFIGYTSAENVTVAGEPLPPEIVEAANDMERAYRTIQNFLPGV